MISVKITVTLKLYKSPISHRKIFHDYLYMQDSGKLLTSRISFIKGKYEIIGMRTLKAEKLDDTPNYIQGSDIYSKCEGNKMKFALFPTLLMKRYERTLFVELANC